MTENSSSSNPRNIRLVEGDMSENTSSSNPRSWKDKRAAVRAARAASKPEGVVEGSTSATAIDNPPSLTEGPATRNSPPSETVPLPIEDPSKHIIRPGVEGIDSTVGTPEFAESPPGVQESGGPISNDANRIPEIPPSPTQLSVSLYPLPDLEHLPGGDSSDRQDPTGSSISAYGRAPSPVKHIVPLYALSDLSEPLDDIDGNLASSLQGQDPNTPAARTFGGVPEVPPSPAQFSIDLYALPTVVENLDDALPGDRDHIDSPSAEHDPSPVQHMVPLYSRTEARDRESDSPLASSR